MATTDHTLIYLDTNVYSRPFDNQENGVIAQEANAFLEIIEAVKEGLLHLLSSDILLFEIYNILSSEKQAQVESQLVLCSGHIYNTDEILQLGRSVERECNIRARDALHIASATIGNARYFLTCDRKVIQKQQTKCYRRLARSHREAYFSAMNPTQFVGKMRKDEIE